MISIIGWLALVAVACWASALLIAIAIANAMRTGGPVQGRWLGAFCAAIVVACIAIAITELTAEPDQQQQAEWSQRHD